MEHFRNNHNTSSQADIEYHFLMCSGIFRTTWSTMNVENVPYVYFGISLERYVVCLYSHTGKAL